MKEVLPPSLLPYLQADGNQFRLEISLGSRDPLFLDNSPYPFLVIDESTPFERLLEAKFVTNSGSVLKRVFILQQKDNYRYSADAMWPLTNSDIDQRWKAAFDLNALQRKSGSLGTILFDDLKPVNGEYLPFRQLYYCAHKDVYFHPPCPECGNLLDLCRDDQLLIQAGLSPYTTSLRRYLYCAGCQQAAGNSLFYAYSRQSNDPATLKDRWDLVNDFGKLILKSEISNGFPCMGCPELSACYGGDNRVMSRIVPFSFYPFYILIVEADTLSAPDFLALVSGAAADELKTNIPDGHTGGRQHCLQLYEQLPGAASGLLFDGDNEKSFLEILFLKVSFLAELVVKFYSDSNQGVYCDASLAFDRTWVRLTDQAGQLPQFWNFTLSVIDLWSDGIHQPRLSKFPPTYGHHFLGNIWFYALLVNQRQSMGAVRAELEKLMLARSDPDKGASEIMPIDVGNPVFAPENIYWHPESKQVAKNWHVLWMRSLELGRAVLAAGLQAEQKWSPDRFWSEFNTLKSDIKAALFEIAPTAAPSPTQTEDIAITGVLSRLLDKWRREMQPADRSKSEERPDTVILNGRQTSADRGKTPTFSSDASSLAPSSADRNTDEEDTLILPTGGQSRQPKPATESAVEDSLQETVIQAPGNRFHPTKTKTDEPEAEPLQKTVILSPEKQSVPPTPGTESPAEEPLQETIILSPAESVSKSARGGIRNANLGAEHIPETIVSSSGERPEGVGKDDAQTTDPDRRRAVPHDFEGSDVPLRLDPKKGAHPPQDDDILTETVILRPKDDKGSKDE